MGIAGELSIAFDCADEAPGKLTLQLGIGGGIGDFWYNGEYISMREKAVGRGNGEEKNEKQKPRKRNGEKQITRVRKWAN